MNNPETLAPLDTQDTGRMCNQEWTTQRHWQHLTHKTKVQSRINNPETLATLDTQDTGRMCNQEWTTQRHWQHWTHKTQDEGAIKNEQPRDTDKIGRTQTKTNELNKTKTKTRSPQKGEGLSSSCFLYVRVKIITMCARDLCFVFRVLHIIHDRNILCFESCCSPPNPQHPLPAVLYLYWILQVLSFHGSVSAQEVMKLKVNITWPLRTFCSKITHHIEILMIY